MALMDTPASIEVQLEEGARRVAGLKRLAEVGVENALRVYKYWSYAESDYPAETILYMAAGERPKTCLINSVDEAVVIDGWHAAP